MSLYNNEIGNVLKDNLQQHSSTVSFDSVWDKHKKSSSRGYKMKKVLTVPMIALITLFTVFTVGFASYGIMRAVDNTDYPFVDDQRVIGKWQVVDFVDEMNQFDPNKKAYDGELYMSENAFINGGNMLTSIEGGNLAYSSEIWTKGMILDKQEKTASKYEIRDINGESYMFQEWKSGDYVFQGLDPKYYVLKKVDSEDYSNIEIPRIEDNIDYPFKDDPQVLGKWTSVDFVENIEDFEPGVKSWLGDLYFTGFDIQENGKLEGTTTSGKSPEGAITWTEGLILDSMDKTASKYEIKEIDGETYMFFEWKSGDYIFRGMKPYYYVLKKAE